MRGRPVWPAARATGRTAPRSLGSYSSGPSTETVVIIAQTRPGPFIPCGFLQLTGSRGRIRAVAEHAYLRSLDRVDDAGGAGDFGERDGDRSGHALAGGQAAGRPFAAGGATVSQTGWPVEINHDLVERPLSRLGAAPLAPIAPLEAIRDGHSNLWRRQLISPLDQRPQLSTVGGISPAATSLPSFTLAGREGAAGEMPPAVDTSL